MIPLSGGVDYGGADFRKSERPPQQGHNTLRLVLMRSFGGWGHRILFKPRTFLLSFVLDADPTTPASSQWKEAVISARVIITHYELWDLDREAVCLGNNNKKTQALLQHEKQQGITRYKITKNDTACTVYPKSNNVPYTWVRAPSRQVNYGRLHGSPKN